jgi:hypothetical protein
LGNPYVVSVPTLNWANEHRVGIIDSGWVRVGVVVCRSVPTY